MLGYQRVRTNNKTKPREGFYLGLGEIPVPSPSPNLQDTGGGYDGPVAMEMG